MNIDITQLLIIFDELMPVTEEDQGIYWLKTQRSDDLIIIFAFSIYESYVDIIIQNTFKTDIASLSLEHCLEVKVIDEKRKCLEILSEHGRCFLALAGTPILDYKDLLADSEDRR